MTSRVRIFLFGLASVILGIFAGYNTYINAVEDGFTFDPSAKEQEIIDSCDLFVSGNPNVDSIYIGFEEAFRFILGQRGKHFDPQVIDAFEVLHDEL